ncbi:Uncharacterized conserved protein [Phaffia rhodozyma]|uniref:Uncharacterized conserved protein n=1 Tax=Phaffia rhodozyma TaxID=264483 RepID=A0A0F7SP82_PHARH|nr:Uncharacterized conserved protein [Phaffia rhodozyma]
MSDTPTTRRLTRASTRSAASSPASSSQSVKNLISPSQTQASPSKAFKIHSNDSTPKRSTASPKPPSSAQSGKQTPNSHSVSQSVHTAAAIASPAQHHYSTRSTSPSRARGAVPSPSHQPLSDVIADVVAKAVHDELEEEAMERQQKEIEPLFEGDVEGLSRLALSKKQSSVKTGTGSTIEAVDIDGNDGEEEEGTIILYSTESTPVAASVALPSTTSPSKSKNSSDTSLIPTPAHSTSTSTPVSAASNLSASQSSSTTSVPSNKTIDDETDVSEHVQIERLSEQPDESMEDVEDQVGNLIEESDSTEGNGSIPKMKDIGNSKILFEDSEDESSSSEESSDDDDEEEDDETEGENHSDEEAYLESLLSKAYANAERSEEEERLRKASEEMVLTMEEETKETKLPSLTAPSLPTPYLSFKQEGKFSRASRTSSSKLSRAPHSLSTATPNAEAGPSIIKKQHELDTTVVERALSKKEAQEARKANAPLAWGELPMIPEDKRKEMVREYHALKLRNSLDPKRFYKGQGSIKHVPEVFAIGTLHSQSKVLQSTTLRSESSARPGSILKELMADEESQAYAKRKFGDLQATRSYNGRKRVVKKSKRN